MPGRRCWVVEGAGSYGAGLAAFLQARGEWVVQVGRRSGRRGEGGKSDALDAVRAAREALAQDHLLAPRRRGDREALRVLLATRHGACAAKVCATNQLKALIVGAPEELRAELRGAGHQTPDHALRTFPGPALPVAEHRMTIKALRLTAQRIQLLAAEAAGLRSDLDRLVAAVAPWLLSCPAWGRSAPPRCWSAGRMPGLGSEAAFAHWPAPIRSRRPRAGHQASAEPRVTASSTAPCTPSCWPGSATTQLPVPTPPGAGRGQGQSEISVGA